MSAQEPFFSYSAVSLPLTPEQRAAIAEASGTVIDDVPVMLDVQLQMDGTFDCRLAVASTWHVDAPQLGKVRITLNPDWTYELVSIG